MAVVDRGLWQKIIQHVVSSGGNLIRPWFTQLEPISLERGLLEIQTPGPADLAIYMHRLVEATAAASDAQIDAAFAQVAAAPAPEEALPSAEPAEAQAPAAADAPSATEPPSLSGAV